MRETIVIDVNNITPKPRLHSTLTIQTPPPPRVYACTRTRVRVHVRVSNFNFKLFILLTLHLLDALYVVIINIIKYKQMFVW